MSEERERKRARLDDDDDDLQTLLLEGDDDFASAANRQAAQAAQRRAQRRERLQRLAAEEETAAVIQQEPQQEEATDSRTPNEPTSAAPPPEARSGATTGSGTESFDMFTSSPPPPPKHTKQPQTSTTNQQRGQGQSDWDDAEGYYNAVIGETIALEHGTELSTNSSSLRFRVDGVIGRGVFSTVLKVTTVHNPSSLAMPPTAAMKLIRSNETMTKAARQEIRFLHQLRSARSVVPLLLPSSDQHPVEHLGHTVLVFPHVEYNLRDVLSKFGKGVGLSLGAVRTYFGQLLSALSHLQKHGLM